MQFCLYAGKGEIRIQKLSKNGKERTLPTKEMSEKEPSCQFLLAFIIIYFAKFNF
jgi:hypothetical protein